MYEYIIGKITGLTPANAVVEAGSIGYFLHISLNTYSAINGQQSARLFLHQVVREDALLLYGFAEQDERELFRQLISVSGIGSSTALMMLSSLSPDEIRKAILEENVNLLKSIKGIGAKTAQRVIIDLKDKIGKLPASDQILMTGADNTIRDEALSALVMLGFARKNVEKELDKILKSNPGITVEQMIKTALKSL
ncbi:Holliday junction branch migration protein RuvA [Mangrovibacterium sp.]|uniref:Holliday junction branch migration protein RuvA n=1 Tax=Mangrovibacterium sp. TaxID=1961364 RepID=UPI003565F0CB